RSCSPPSLFYEHIYHRDLHSFPTRRSSDLQRLQKPTCFLSSSVGSTDWDMTQRASSQKDSPIRCPAWCSTSRCRRWRSTSTGTRSEEHTSELQSRENLVCRLLLEKKNRKKR